jgi:branched-subunit amino acid ABC-type transport system permease component
VKAWLPFVVSGIATGSIFALAALGLVLTQKTSGVFNFAHGAVAATGAYALFDLWQLRHVPWPLAAAFAILVVGPLLGLLLEWVTRTLGSARVVMRIVATVGLLLALQGGLARAYGSAVRRFPPFLPTGTFSIAGTRVGWDQLVTVAVTLAGAVGLSLFLSRNRLGVAMRGVVDDPALLGLMGTDPTRVRRWSWVIGSAFAAASGVLIGPLLGLDATLLTLLVVQAFGAAAIGRFNSLPLTYAGGLAVGILGAFATKIAADVPSIAGLPPGIPFLVLFAVLVILPKRLPRERRLRRPILAAPRLVRPNRAALAVVGIAVLAVPHVVGARLPVYMAAAAYAVIFLSLGLLVGTAGQVSLCQAAFAAVGAATFYHLTADAGLPWLVALLLTGVVTIPLGAVVAIPAIRLSGVYLALATFGFGILLQQVFYSTNFMFTKTNQRVIPRPSAFHSDTAYYYVLIAIVAAAMTLVLLVQRSRLGRLLRALSDSPLALTTQGTSVSVSLTLVFCLSAFLAGIGGALLGGVTEAINGSGLGPFNSLLWLGVLALCGNRLFRAAGLAAVLLSIVPNYTSTAPELQTAIFGVLAIAAALLSDGVVDIGRPFRRWADHSEDRLTTSPVATRTAEVVA